MEVKVMVEIPKIIEKDQQEVIEWGRVQRQKHISFTTIVEKLVSEKNTKTSNTEDGLEEVQEIYKKYNNKWREEMLVALMVDNYRFKNDVKEGDIVTDGNVVGYVGVVHQQHRNIEIYTTNKRMGFIGNYAMDNFTKVGV